MLRKRFKQSSTIVLHPCNTCLPIQAVTFNHEPLFITCLRNPFGIPLLVNSLFCIYYFTATYSFSSTSTIAYLLNSTEWLEHNKYFQLKLVD